MKKFIGSLVIFASFQPFIFGQTRQDLGGISVLVPEARMLVDAKTASMEAVLLKLSIPTPKWIDNPGYHDPSYGASIHEVSIPCPFLERVEDTLIGSSWCRQSTWLYPGRPGKGFSIRQEAHAGQFTVLEFNFMENGVLETFRVSGLKCQLNETGGVECEEKSADRLPSLEGCFPASECAELRAIREEMIQNPKPHPTFENVVADLQPAQVASLNALGITTSKQ